MNHFENEFELLWEKDFFFVSINFSNFRSLKEDLNKNV